MTWPFPYDSPDSLAGQLQRGLGRGYLAALDAPSEEVHQHLMKCILGESRLDHQVDSRRWYYGELAWLTELPVEPLEAHLVGLGDDRDGDGWLALNVLGHLAVRGHDGAVDILRKYVRYGGWWDEALSELGRAQRPEYWQGLETAAADRVTPDPGGIDLYLGNEPLATFARTVPAFVAMKQRADNFERTDAESEKLRGLSTEELLQSPVTAIHERAKVLAERTAPIDREALTHGLAHADIKVRALAARALAEQGSSEGYDTAKQILVGLRGWERLVARGFTTKALTAMPADLVLPLARKWRSSRRAPLRDAGRAILESHANSDDVPWIRNQLRRKWSIDAEGELLFAAELAARLWVPTMLGDLRRLFGEFVYSYGRMHLTEVLAGVDPEFSTTLAVECLWDCEPDSRRLGVLHADPADVRVRKRLEEIAVDAAEEPGVRELAQAKLTSTAPS
ncbi:MAG: hypothetical protein KC492_38210, partial [Myxococcales bacterium]|nr:hypothetical protein [Myxococcales bacterium]